MSDTAPPLKLQSPNARPPMPEGLPPAAEAEWERVVGELQEEGRLAKADRAILVEYVETWTQLTEARAKLKELGSVIRHPNGQVGANPYVAIERDGRKHLLNLIDRLGLTPSARKPAADDGQMELDFD